MSLYSDLIGAEFETLPVALRLIHGREGLQQYRGEVKVIGAKTWLATLCAAASGLPADYAGRLKVEIIADAANEQWTRHFGAYPMRSRLRARDGYLCERLGLVSFRFGLRAIRESIVWYVAAVRVCGLPLPSRWFAGVSAVESVRNDRYRFDVRAELPGIGLLVHYIGWLDVR